MKLHLLVAAPLPAGLREEVVITIDGVRSSPDTLYGRAGKVCKCQDIRCVPNNGSNRKSTPREVACINEQIAISIFG
jgi:hypothetical protein